MRRSAELKPYSQDTNEDYSAYWETELSNFTTPWASLENSTRTNTSGLARALPRSNLEKGNMEILISLHGIIFLLALVGNGLVITTLAQNRRMRTITNIFLLNLAINDLMFAIVCMPFTIIPVLMQNFIFGETVCVLIRYLQGVTVSASAFTLVAISLERFFAICNPLKSRKWQNLRHSYKVIAIIWLTALTVNIPMAIYQTVVRAPDGSKQCLDEWPKDKTAEMVKMVYYVFHLLVTDLLVPLTIMSIAYGLIARKLWNGFKTMHVVDAPDLATKAKRQMSLTSEASDISDETEIPLTGNTLTPPALGVEGSKPFNFTSKGHRNSVCRQETLNSMRSHSSRQNVRSKKRVIKMLFVIVIEFFVCWTPLYLVYIWLVLDKGSLGKHMKRPQLTMGMLRLLAYISSCCNPITYCFMSKKFRQAFLTAFHCRSKQKVPLGRRATFQSTQVSYCENTPSGGVRTRLSIPSLNNNHSKLASVLETPMDFDMMDIETERQ